MDPVDIELVDHIAWTRRKQLSDGTIDEPRRIDHSQYIVNADGIHIGFMGKQPGAHLAMVVWVDEETKAAIVDAINAKLPAPIGGVSMIPDPDLGEPEDDEDSEEEYAELDFENEDF